MHISEQARYAFNLLREAQDVKDELQKKRQHMDERMYVKSLLSLDDTIDCCARIIHKNICLISRDITRMCKEAKDVLSSRVR